MQYVLRACVVALTLVAGAPTSVFSMGQIPGNSVESLLEFARERNPEYATMRYEAEAAGERVAPAGSLPDPRFRTDSVATTNADPQNLNLLPNHVYTLTQDVPWFGKRNLKREIAELEAESAKGRVIESWADLSTRIKSFYAQFYYVHQNERLTREVLVLMAGLEKIAHARYASGLAAQQDVIRAQVEQTNLKNQLVVLENERRQIQARLNALLARPSNALLRDPEHLRPLPAPEKLDYAVLEDRVRAHNPQVFVEETRIKTAEKARELAYKNRYPDFTFGIVQNQFQNSVKEWDVMVEINIPLQQGSRRSQERESESMLSAARARRETAANQVLSEFTESLDAQHPALLRPVRT